jgi:hypothetical protein
VDDVFDGLRRLRRHRDKVRSIRTTIAPTCVLPYQVRVASRKWQLDFSIVSQLDGLLHGLLGLRIERDVRAASLSESHCDFFGRSAFESCSSFIGLYEGAWEDMHEYVQMASDHNALGVFVVPVWPHRGPMITLGVRKPRREQVQVPWYDALCAGKVCKLMIDLPKDCYSVGGIPQVAPHGIQAIVADFGWIGKCKSKRRPEKRWPVKAIPELRVGVQRLNAIPTIITRESPDMDELNRDLMGKDDKPCEGPCKPSAEAVGPARVKSRWDSAKFNAISEDYPYLAIRELARQAAGKGVDPFKGQLRKTLTKVRQLLTPDQYDECRVNMMEDVELGNTMGPLCEVPFAWYRLCELFSVPKKKHDPTSTAVRLISNFAAGHDMSINALNESPRILAFHCGAKHLRDRIAQCGPGAWCWTADIPKCFRRQRILTKLLPLFVYQIVTKKHGKEFFVDLSTPFGWTPSEWGWQVILAVLMWEIRRIGMDDMLAYVDNFFLFGEKGRDSALCDDVLEQFFKFMGVDLHERMAGRQFKGLGWDWDMDLMVMICPDDKHTIIMSYLATWAKATVLSVEQLETACGIMTWLSAGFPNGRAQISWLVQMRTTGQARHKRGRLPKSKVLVKVTDEVRVTLQFWHKVFPKWRKRCPIRADFNPTATYQSLGRGDASTKWGYGAWLYDGTRLQYVMRAWTDAERKRAKVLERESTGVLELWAMELWLRAFGPQMQGQRVHFDTDSGPACLAVGSAYSPRPRMVEAVMAIQELCVQFHIILRVRHVIGDVFNIIADHLSHDRLRDAQCQARKEFGLRLSPARYEGTR